MFCTVDTKVSQLRALHVLILKQKGWGETLESPGIVWETDWPHTGRYVWDGLTVLYYPYSEDGKPHAISVDAVEEDLARHAVVLDVLTRHHLLPQGNTYPKG